MLSLLHHPNLVNLIGYCADGDQRLLVYEFMPLGSLEDHLLGNNFFTCCSVSMIGKTINLFLPRWLGKSLAFWFWFLLVHSVKSKG